MNRRSAHGTYEEERTYFLTTLHAQIHILREHGEESRERVIESLGLLLHRIRGLRMAGQAEYKGDSAIWTDKCNTLYQKVVWFRNRLTLRPSSASRVANDIESFMLFLNFCIPKEFQYRIHCDNPRRGERSGAPSPEPVVDLTKIMKI